MSIWAKILAVLGAILAILVTAARVLAGAKKAGVDQARADASDRVLDTVREAGRAQSEVSGSTDDAVDSWLRAPDSRKR